MSFIRATGSEPKWVENANVGDVYAYSDGECICGMPRQEYDFVEVVMRMLEQSGELSDEELENVLEAFESRLHWDGDGF